MKKKRSGEKSQKKNIKGEITNPSRFFLKIGEKKTYEEKKIEKNWGFFIQYKKFPKKLDTKIFQIWEKTIFFFGLKRQKNEKKNPLTLRVLGAGKKGPPLNEKWYFQKKKFKKIQKKKKKKNQIGGPKPCNPWETVFPPSFNGLGVYGPPVKTKFFIPK